MSISLEGKSHSVTKDRNIDYTIDRTRGGSNVELTVKEKIRLITGNGMWRTDTLDGKVKELLLTDGPHGVRKEKVDNKYDDAEPATSFPTASCVACSFDTELIAQMAQALADEAKEKGTSILLGPGINMKRTPLCGRNFEYFSEDPYLSGTLAANYIKRIEEKGVGTSLKHFAVNNQESNRQTANSQVDERALHEIYLRAFEIGVTEGKPATVMSSYNKINGTYAGESKWLLTDVLRKKWGFEGAVVSDWSATVDLPACISAGMDLEMPDSLGIHGKDVERALEKGTLAMDDLDRAVQNVLALASEYGGEEEFEAPNYDHLAKKIATESAVLLKNEEVLPVLPERTKEIVVIGALAHTMRFQGGGSSNMNAQVQVNALDAFKNAGFSVTFEPGYSIDSEDFDEEICKKAMNVVDANKPLIVFGGLTDIIEGEGFDRQHMHLPKNQQVLMERLKDLHQNIIYVSFSGAPYEMPFAEHVKGILQMYLAGQEVGQATVDLLTGVVNPSGKLAETWPYQLEDVLSTKYFDRKSKDLEYRESLFIGYRYFDTYDVPVLFPFGHGLSYTEFTYTDLIIEKTRGKIPTEISVQITNRGAVLGKESVQIYVKNPTEHFIREKRKLVGFGKVALAPGETKTLRIKIDARAFDVYDVQKHDYVQSPGEYVLQVASSIQCILLEKKIKIEGDPLPWDDRDELSDFYQERPNISQNTFKKLYGKPLSNFDRIVPGSYSLANSINDMAKVSRYARFIRKNVLRIIYARFSTREKNDPQVQMMVEGALTGPVDAVICQSNIPYAHNVGLSMVDMANKKPLKAVTRLFGVKDE